MNKLLVIMEKAYQRIPKKLSDGLYLAAFALVLLYDYNFLTCFDREPFRVSYIAGAALAAVVLALRFLNVKNERKADLGFAAALLLIGVAYFLVRHSLYFLVLAMLIVGALRVEDKKIYAVYLLIAALFFTVMLANFMSTTTGWERKHSVDFGSINSSDCQAMVFFILAVFLCLRESRVGFAELVALGAVVLWFWNHTGADINMYCSLACLALVGVMKAGKALELELGHKPRRALGYIVSASFLLCAAAMLVLAFRYDPDKESWRALDELLHNRLSPPHRMAGLYPPSLFGSEFVQVGHGYSPGADYDALFAQYGYTYIDSSYPQILINHGYLVFAMILGVMTFVSFRYAQKGDLCKVLLLAVIAVDCAAEGHLKEISCNVWLILPFAGYDDVGERGEERKTDG